MTPTIIKGKCPAPAGPGEGHTFVYAEVDKSAAWGLWAFLSARPCVACDSLLKWTIDGQPLKGRLQIADRLPVKPGVRLLSPVERVQ